MAISPSFAPSVRPEPPEDDMRLAASESSSGVTELILNSFTESSIAVGSAASAPRVPYSDKNGAHSRSARHINRSLRLLSA